MNKAMTFVIPQWQGGGQDLCTYDGAYAMLENYLGGEADVVIRVGRDPVSGVKEGVLGYEDILRSTREVNRALREHAPDKLLVIGGGCDADTPCAAWLNDRYDGDMAVVYLDSHGDLNTPRSSDSHLYYGMSLRALAGDSAPAIVEEMARTIRPEQLIACGGRNLDPEEIRFMKENRVSSFSVEELERDPGAAAEEIRRKGFSHVYIHIDFDVLDPEEFSLTPVPEPEGMTKKTLLELVRALGENCRVVGLGMLEYSGTGEDRGDPFLEGLIAFGREQVLERK